MSRDPSSLASSPRGGLCKALKDMKCKVATHTGMSLTFVELVATSPAVVLLPVLPPSPRSPSALLHRRMHQHSYTFSHAFSSPATRRCSAEATSCSDAETAMETSTSDVCSMGNPVCCKSSVPSASDRMSNNHASPSPPASCSCHMNGTHSSGTGLCGSTAARHMLSSPSASRCNAGYGHSTSSSPWRDFSCRQQFEFAPDNSGVELSCERNLCLLDPSGGSMSFAEAAKHASNIVSGTQPVLCFIITLVFGLIGIMKSFYVSFLRSGMSNHNKLAVKALKGDITEMDNEFERHEKVASRHLSPQTSKTSRQRSKLLKNKLKSSFKNLSVQVPRKAFVPLHPNTPSASSSLSSTSSSPSPSPSCSISLACSCSPTTKKIGTPSNQGLACRLTKPFNQRASQCSPTTGTCFSPPSFQHEARQQTFKRLTTTTISRDSVLASLVSFALALCGLFFGKLVAGGVVTTWLLILSITDNTRMGRKIVSPLGQI